MRASLLRITSSVPLGACLALLIAAPWLSCGGDGETETEPVDAGADVIEADGGEDAGADADPGPDTLPCDVRAVIEHHCLSCHSSPPTSGAGFSLVSRFDFLQPSTVPGETVGQRSLARMKSLAAPMPPESEPPPAPAALAVIEQWVAGGMPAGECGTVPAKPAATTCTSGMFWADGDTGSAQMNPGLPCRSCHQMLAPELAFFFAGTAFPSFHEQDLCVSPPPPDARVEILDSSGAVTLTLLPNAAGNFTSNAVVPGVPLPYRARLVANGLTRSMTGLQDSGDCNGCHTEQGEDDAPGRLVWPSPMPAL